MVVFKSAINNYLTRPLRDLQKRKRWSEKVVQQKMRALRPRPRFHSKPLLHQQVGFLTAVEYPKLFCLYDMGLGKTKMALDVVRYLKMVGRVSRVLVLVPNVVNLESWLLEVAKHTPSLSVAVVEGSRAARIAAWNLDSDICLCTYAGLQALLCSAGGGRKRRRKIDPVSLRDAKKLFDGVVMDEATALMNHTSMNFQLVKQLTANFELRLGLTGTPLGRDPHTLWSQFYCVDRGEALGQTLGIFRQAFFSAKQGYWGGTEYAFLSRNKNKLRRLMAHTSLRYSSEECLDLPEKVMVEKPFVLSDQAWSYYQAVVKQIQVKRNIDMEGSFVRLRQISSGFVSIEGVPALLTTNPKLELLDQLLLEIPRDCKVVIFNEFIVSGDQICKQADRRGWGYARLYSGTKNKAEQLRKFNGDSDCRLFVVNSQSGAQGLNLQQARYVIFYESPVSPIIRKQAEKRCHRPGQTERVFIYDLVARNTVEQKILRYLAEGRNLFTALLGGKETVE